jgi:ATP-binding cassette subfamily C (CFTR/MRP) protein 4
VKDEILSLTNVTCGLQPDLEIFANHDATIVGDRVVQCSGGQKSCIALARALYKDTDVVLLDDPISAVDAKVAQHIYQYAIQELCICRQKCVILVTHQHRFIGSDATSVLMENGTIVTSGSYSECVGNQTDMALKSFFYESTVQDDHSDESLRAGENNSDDTISDATSTSKSSHLEFDTANVEKNSTALIGWKTWRGYAEAKGGWPILVVFIGVFAVTQAALLLTIVQVGRWSELAPQEQVRRIC